MHRHAGGQRSLLDWRSRYPQAAPVRPVGLSNDANDFKMFLCKEMFQRGNGKRGRAAENEAQATHSATFSIR